MKPSFLRIIILISTLFVLALALPVQAHDDVEPLWAMTPRELGTLEKSIQRHRRLFIAALAEASQAGVTASSLERPYKLDSEKQTVDIPRSVLNRVIISSMNLEIATTELYLFCETGCEHSLAKDLAGHPDQKRAVGVIRSLWPKMKASFAILWRDIPMGVWSRVINASKYARSIGSGIRYHAQAYGPFSMTVGAVGFGVAFGATEIAETMFMGPLHFVCKANYFWSVAFGTAVASLSRDLRSLILFDKDGKSIFERLSQAFGNFRSIKEAQRLEKRALFRGVVGDQNIEVFRKMTKREAHSSVLEPLLDTLSAEQAVASDPMLWSELTWEIAAKQLSPDTSHPQLETEHEKLFDHEIDKLFIATPGRSPVLRWQDLNASLRVALRIFRNSAEVEQMIYFDRSRALKTLGKLDMQLRNFDLFMISWLTQREATKAALPWARTAPWVRDVVTEWFAIAIEASRPLRGAEAHAEIESQRLLQIRLNHLNTMIEASAKMAEPVGALPADARENMEKAVAREAKPSLRTEASRTTIRTCESIFSIAN